jgi:hypothetical protein
MAITKPTFYPDGTAIGDGTDITLTKANIADPLRTTGYAYQAQLASAEYNEMFKELAKWMKWLDQAFPNAINNDSHSTAAGKISFLTLSGTCGATGDLTGSSAIIIPAEVTPANLVSISVLLEFTGSGTSRWVPSGTTISGVNVGFFFEYYSSSTWNIIDVFSRGSDVNHTTTKYKILIAYFAA